jgi:hypothetical protein
MLGRRPGFRYLLSTGEFINGVPTMNYGTANTWHGRILGVYVPE